jgi:ArsR family transcriptional regulator
LGEAGLVERFKEGSWVFCRAADRGTGAELGAAIAALADPALQETDKARLAHVRQTRANEAAAYFKSNAAEWERIRALHAPEADVEHAIARHLTAAGIENFLDAGTGTGRMLELIAPHAKRAVGIDVSPDMLAIARDRLLRGSIRNAQVRLGDIFRLPFPNGSAGSGFDVVLFHQVLHILDDPGAAVSEAARVMAPGRQPADRRFRAS